MLFTIATITKDPLNHDVCEDEDNFLEPWPSAVQVKFTISGAVNDISLLSTNQ